MNKWTMLFVVVLLITASACTAVENPAVDQALEANQVQNDEIEMEPEPEPTPEPVEEEELTPTPAISPAMESLELVFLEDGIGMSSSGPWMVFPTSLGLVAVAADGSEVASLGFPLDDRTVYSAIASHGGVMALVKEDFDSLPGDGEKWLEIRSFPTNDLIFSLELLGYSGEPFSFAYEQDERDFVEDRHRAVGQVEWSHDGETLAFVGSQDGPSPDVYTYSLNSGEVLQLTSGPAHAVDLAWSPDDAYIFHAGVDKMWTGYSGAGYSGWTFYAARPDGSEVLQVYDGTEEIQQEILVGWYSDTDALMASGYWWCGLFDYRMIDIESGEITTIMKGQHTYSAYDPVSKKTLVWIDPDQVDTEECGPAGEAGFFLVSVPGGEVEKLEGYPKDFSIMEIEWDQTGGVFLVDGYKTWLVVDPEKGILDLQQQPIHSPDGKWIAYLDRDGSNFSIYDVDNDGTVEIQHEGAILYPTWSPDSSALFYFQEREKSNRFDLYRMEMPGLTSSLVVEDIFERYSRKPIWLMP